MAEVSGPSAARPSSPGRMDPVIGPGMLARALVGAGGFKRAVGQGCCNLFISVKGGQFTICHMSILPMAHVSSELVTFFPDDGI